MARFTGSAERDVTFGLPRWAESTRATSVRSRHFTLRLPVWYRAVDEVCWHKAVTDTIGSTGATICADEPAPAMETLMIVISLQSAGESGGCLVGQGRIVRTRVSGQTNPPIFEVAVPRFRLERRERVLPDVTH